MRAANAGRGLERRERWALALLCLLAFAWRLQGLAYQSLWRDEVDSIRFAGRALPELLRMFAKPGENGPLFFTLLRPWLALAGDSEFALRFQAVAAGLLVVPLTWLLARRLLEMASHGQVRFPPALATGNVPLVAALLAAASPYLVWYSQEGKMYAVLTALALAASLAFLAALKRNRAGQWLLYLALLAALALTHVLALLLVAVHAVWLLLLGRRYRRRWLPFGAVLLLPLIPFLRLAGWWQITLLLDPTFQTGHPFVPLHEIVTSLASSNLRGLGILADAWWIAPLLFLALVGIAFSGRALQPVGAAGDEADQPARAARVNSALLLVWLLLPSLALFLLSLSKPLFTDRYVIWVVPALLLLLAQGVAGLGSLWRPLGWIALAGLLALMLQGGWRQTHQPVKADMRAAVQFVETQRQPGEPLMFQIPYTRHTYEYYAGPQADALDGPYTNAGSAPEEMDAAMRAALGDSAAVWLVLSEAALWDQRGLAQAWLEREGVATQEGTFHRITVVRYQMGIEDAKTPAR